MKSVVLLLVLLSLALLPSACAFANSIIGIKSTTTTNTNTNNDNSSKNKKTLLRSFNPKHHLSIVAKASSSAAASSAASAALLTSTISTKDIIAKALGYVLGFGALAVYLPIIINLLKSKSADGYSVETWVYNLLGLSIACLYPFKKGFGVSTYIEILAITIQSAGILGLICYYQERFKEYLIGMLVFISSIAYVCIGKVPTQFLNWMQVAAIIICNYANIPQILLTFQTKKATWSWITSAMSMAGNLIRVFTTIQLTKDKLVLSGNTLGFLTNLILFVQVFIYKNSK